MWIGQKKPRTLPLYTLISVTLEFCCLHYWCKMEESSGFDENVLFILYYDLDVLNRLLFKGKTWPDYFSSVPFIHNKVAATDKTHSSSVKQTALS